MEAAQLEQVEGVVSSLVFQNEENGYTILRLEQGEEEFTVVGSLPGVVPGEFLCLHGAWVRHPTYGRQFRAELAERRLPQGQKEIFHFLSSGAVKGIGKATARRLLEEFGEDTLTVLEENPERLTCIRGLTLKRARQLGDAFRQQMGMRLLLEFFSEHRLPAALVPALYRAYGQEALSLVKADPYLLAEEELGGEFSAADRLALELGLGPDAPRRLEAGLLFELAHNLNNGHAFLPWGKLVDATARLLDCPTTPLEEALEALCARGGAVAERITGQEGVYLPALHQAESYIARRVRELAAGEFTPPEGLEALLGRIQREQSLRYSPLQAQAVRLGAQRQMMLLTGGPGTGKTTCLRGVLALFEALGLQTALAAPTGRAAKRLGELCGAEAATIHRMLEAGFDPHSGRLVFCRGEEEPLDADAVIVDETSMVDVPLMAALLAALPAHCRLVLVGDPDQLPSVGPGSVLADLLRSEAVEAVRLTEVFRQAAESAIIRSAHLVNRGEPPELGRKDGDFFFLTRREPQAALETIVDLCRRRVPEGMGIPSDQIQVLSPTRRRGLGTAALNQALQAALNPPAPEKGELRFGDWLFRQGDRVMQVKNNYDILWREGDTGRAGMGVFNGDIGLVLAAEGGVVTVEFDGKRIDYTQDMLGELEPAFAVTVHKAQGSEYRAVILAALEGPPMLMTRGVLYTAITRAKSLFIGVGSPETVARMAANQRQSRRYSGLRARLTEEIE